LIGGYCNSDKLIITISFLTPLLLVEVILFLVVVLRNVNTLAVASAIAEAERNKQVMVEGRRRGGDT
jgi:hypothetical protein